ncbi:MAG: hypothetical protein SH850_09295 [Planctomycetaceae bacterium]|nr:hypothetical protein [Planctomycetaceae bacterium]
MFTLYDWKLTSLCDIALWTPEELWASDEPVELNIGSKAPATASDAADFIAFLARTTSAVPDAVAGTQIFAPVDFWSGVRLMLRISEQDIPRGRRWRRTVVDLETGRRYRAWSASCDLPGCLCDAYVEEIPRGSSD